MTLFVRVIAAIVAGAAAMAGCASPGAGARGLEKIEHIVDIYAENRSFDNLYGLFPGANGIARATAEQHTQLDHDSTPFKVLPPVRKGKEPDPTFPTNLPNRPFQIDGPPINLPPSVPTRDLAHRYYQNIEQINGGKKHMADIFERIRKSPLRPRVAIIVTYDENGGFWDHVRPPHGGGWSDRWGPGSRIPAIIVSPYARRGYVDSTTYDTTSIIKFRHGVAMEVYEQHRDLEQVRGLLGHTRIKTAQLYAQIRPAALKHALEFCEAKALDL